MAAARAANSKAPDTHDYDEATTRDVFIDLLLAEAGWTFYPARLSTRSIRSPACRQ